MDVKRFAEAKALLRETLPVAQRILGENHDVPLGMRLKYAQALCLDPAATLDNIREAVTTLEELERTARRVLGGKYPTAVKIEESLQNARATLRAREDAASGVGSICEAVGAMTT